MTYPTEKANAGIPGSQAWCGDEMEHGCEACRPYQRQCGVFITHPATVLREPDVLEGHKIVLDFTRDEITNDFSGEEPTKRTAPLFLDPDEFDDDYTEMVDDGGESG